MNQVVIKRRKQWKIEDLTKHDMELLSEAAHLPDKTWMCFGWSFYKLLQLNAVDEETFITPYGFELVRAYARMMQ